MILKLSLRYIIITNTTKLCLLVVSTALRLVMTQKKYTKDKHIDLLINNSLYEIYWWSTWHGILLFLPLIKNKETIKLNYHQTNVDVNMKRWSLTCFLITQIYIIVIRTLPDGAIPPIILILQYSIPYVSIHLSSLTNNLNMLDNSINK